MQVRVHARLPEMASVRAARHYTCNLIMDKWDLWDIVIQR